MTSQVNPYNIDGTFPVAGQDNDSQGFRDNFTNTRNNFAFIKSELEDIQAKAVFKSALNNTVLDNDLGNSGTTLTNAQLTAYSETFLDNGSLSGAQVINYTNGNYQKIATGGSLTLSFDNWPSTGILGRLQLWINVTSTAYTVTFPSQVDLGFPSEIAGSSSNVLTFDATGNYLYEFISSDNGTHFFARDLTRAANKVHGNLTVTGGLTTSGARIENGYQYSAAANHFNATINNNVSRYIMDPAATLSNGTLTLPSANVDATVVTVSSTQIVTNFQVKPNTGITLVPSANVTMSAGGSATFFFHASESKWYKIG